MMCRWCWVQFDVALEQMAAGFWASVSKWSWQNPAKIDFVNATNGIQMNSTPHWPTGEELCAAQHSGKWQHPLKEMPLVLSVVYGWLFKLQSRETTRLRHIYHRKEISWTRETIYPKATSYIQHTLTLHFAVVPSIELNVTITWLCDSDQQKQKSYGDGSTATVRL